MTNRSLLSFATFLFGISAVAQHNYIPLDSRLNDRIPMTGTHRSIWPARLDENSMLEVSKALDSSLEAHGWWDKDMLRRKLSDEHLIDMGGEDWSLFVDPIFTMHGGFEFTSDGLEGLSYNTRGGHVEGRLGSQFTFETTLIESQIFVPQYLNSYIENYGVVPGEGIAKEFFTNGWDHRWSSGSLSYTPSKFFNFSVGQGKFFYGEGYRSLLLSDNALNYPYFRIETTFGPFKYVNLWTQMYDIRESVNLNPGNRRKWISTHYLSWNVTERLNISLYEAVVYGSDTLNGGLDASFFNPVILYRPIEDQMDSRLGNVLLGMQSSYHFPGGHNVYGQFLIEEFVFDALVEMNGSWLNKFGTQLGYSYTHNFGPHRVNALVEWNRIRPFVYTHRNVLMNYAHFNQPIAHPLGADVNEWILRLRWERGRWSALAHFSTANAGLANTINGTYYAEGVDLWTPYTSRSRDHGFSTNDQPSVRITNARFRLAWMAQTAWKMELFGEWGYRSGPMYPAVAIDGVAPPTTSSNWITFGVRTQLYRTYSDI
ncbi:capsule assembly Wzi family protein [Phaeocystidibacter marisrubri]|uniref:Capsule assembly Wzi family protein n=1 Tax=Phaeocystidibacter marisrubri TaxID=1577780 RepID=A0A6L3ZJG9_9FLAO|nr:capsule assembly Wzi family protein [Phaeocystidibacter marisrubri]KAB2817793.1 capsule assembly Wzi family protein [Phaeocystidibacter marisrubri]